MKILITGSKGQLASEILSCLKTGKTELGDIPQILLDAQITAPDKDALDISDSTAVNELFEKERFDFVINCAAFTKVDECETHREAALKVNAIGAKNLAAACEKTGAALMHISTDYVFEGNDAAPYCEYDACRPQSVYGKTKYLGERYVQEFCHKYFIVRTSWLYGYNANNFVRTIKKSGEVRAEINVVNDQWGNPTNAAELAHHILKLLATREYGIYHCSGNGESVTWYEFACEIMRLYGLDCKVKPCTTAEYPTKAKRPAFSSLDNMMLRITVGDEMRDWRKALEAFVKKEIG